MSAIMRTFCQKILQTNILQPTISSSARIQFQQYCQHFIDSRHRVLLHLKTNSSLPARRVDFIFPRAIRMAEANRSEAA